MLSQMLAAYLGAPPGNLGYVPLPAPIPFSLPDLQRLEDFAPLAGIPTVRPVYTAMLSGSGEVVVKLGTEAQIDREVRPSLEQVFTFNGEADEYIVSCRCHSCRSSLAKKGCPH